MGSFRKGIIKSLRGCLVILVISFLLQFCFHGFIEKGVTEIIINSDALTTTFSKFGLKNSQVERALNDEVVNDFIDEIVDGFLYDFSKGEVVKNNNLPLKIKTFILDNRRHIEDLIGFKLYDSFINGLDSEPTLLELDGKYIEIISFSKENVPEYCKTILVLLTNLSKLSYGLLLAILMISVFIIIILVHWNDYSWLTTLGGDIIGCGVFMFIITCLVNYFFRSLLLYLPVQITFDFMKLFYSAIITLGIGIIFKLIYFIVEKIKDRRELKELEIS